MRRIRSYSARVLSLAPPAALALAALLTSSARAQSSRQLPGGADASVDETLFSQRSAASPAMAAPAVVAGAVDPDQYVVGPGDVFELNYSGRVTRSVTIAVGPEGTLFVPGAGAIKLDGLTLSEARRELIRRAAAQFTGVTLDARLARVRIMRVFLTGEVKQAGPIEIPAGSRVSEMLSDTLLTGHSSHRNIIVVRRSVGGKPGEQAIADLERFNRTGNASLDPWLRDGDVVQVPVAMRFVEMRGAVGSGGRFELGPSDSLSTLLELARGTLPSSESEHALLLRFTSATATESSFFNLADLRSGSFNPVLRDGDHVYIYFAARYHDLDQASIFGEVKRPGAYPLIRNHTRLSNLVSASGGFLDHADLSTIRVYRASRFADEPDPEIERLSRLSRSEMTASEYEVLRARLAQRREDYRVDWNRLQQEPELDLLLSDGDVVRVDPLLATVRVEGEVKRPGLVEYEAKRSVDEYVRLAGGYSNRAAHSKVRITRSVTGQNMLARDASEIAPGDLIWVPERPDVTVWQNLQTLITVAAQVATVIIAVRK